MRRTLMLLALLWAPLVPAAVHALESAPVVSPQARVTLIADRDAVAPGETLRMALRITMAPGWYTYWSNPGDSGLPAELALTLPQGGTATKLAFPTPERLPFGPLVNFGLRTEALLPFTVTVPATLGPGDTFTLAAEARWLVCENVCIPEDGAFLLEIPVGTAVASAETPRLDAAEAALPRQAPFVATAGFDGGAGQLRVTDPALTPATVRDAFFFPAAMGVLDAAAPQALGVQDGAITLTLARGQAEAAWPIEGVLAITDGAGRRVGYQVSASQVAVSLPATAPAGLAQALLLAFLGGLILNLMPCVFPILAMKAMGLARLGGAQARAVRLEAASYTLGVVLGFLVLAGVMLGFRAAGASVGWGFQLQSPWVVAALAWLMLAVGLNLSGVFAVGGAVGVGSGLAARGGHAGSFATGALAVVVATPCTAPFMAAALGAALLLPAPLTLAVFLALGLGMAAPYAVLALFPGLAARLPRPGAWMQRLRQVLAFPMYAAAAWLLWVLAQQAGPDGLAVGLAGALLVALAAWLIGLATRAPRLAGAVVVLAALALLPALSTTPTTAPAVAGTEAWSAARVAALQAQGRSVFVNVSAAWCISCKVNERVALDTDTVRAAFTRANVAYLSADWTNGDAAITALLRAHGRAGVPLYLLYPAGGGAPRLLPEILTPGIVLAALDPPRAQAALPAR
jgi:thiol:disulfide interchange protein